MTPGPGVMARRVVLPKPQEFLIPVAGMATLVQRARIGCLETSLKLAVDYFS